MLRQLRCHAHFLFLASQITWYRLLIQIHILDYKQWRARLVCFLSQLIWIFTVCKGRANQGFSKKMVNVNLSSENINQSADAQNQVTRCTVDIRIPKLKTIPSNERPESPFFFIKWWIGGLLEYYLQTAFVLTPLFKACERSCLLTQH